MTKYVLLTLVLNGRDTIVVVREVSVFASMKLGVVHGFSHCIARIKPFEIYQIQLFAILNSTGYYRCCQV